MNSSIIKRAANFIRQQKQNKLWKRVVGSLAVLVVFVTTYMLILPAITMEQGPSCGKEEHIHTAECYATIPAERILTCPYENSDITVIHQHDANCYDAYGNLICTLPEVQMHQHTESCYASQTFLVCMQEEGEGHIHTDECYSEDGMLICPLEESFGHIHGPECYQTEYYLVCGQDEVVPHIHGIDCQIQPDELFFDCGLDEAVVHQHDESCFTTVGEDSIVLVCGMEEHVHDPACYPTNVMEEELNLAQEASEEDLEVSEELFVADETISDEASQEFLTAEEDYPEAVSETEEETAGAEEYTEPEEAAGIEEYTEPEEAAGTEEYTEPEEAAGTEEYTEPEEAAGIEEYTEPEEAAGTEEYNEEATEIEENIETEEDTEAAVVIEEAEDETEEEFSEEDEESEEAEDDSNRIFRYEDEAVEVQVSVPETEEMPEDILLEVQKVPYDLITPAAFQNAIDPEQLTIRDADIYRIALTDAETEENWIAEQYEVTISYKEPVFSGKETEEAEPSILSFINGTEVAADIAYNEEQTVSGYKVSSAELGEFALVLTEEAEQTENTRKEYTYEDDLVYVTAVLENAADLPDDAVLCVTQMNPESSEYANAEAALEQYIRESNVALDGSLYYDIHFEVDGEEIEPAGKVGVQISYKSAVVIAEETSEESIQILHFNETSEDTVVEDVTSQVSLDDTGAVQSVGFSTDSFSTFVIVNRQETIKARLEAPNGEYYLHVVADVDGTPKDLGTKQININNNNPENVNWSIDLSQVPQEVYLTISKSWNEIGAKADEVLSFDDKKFVVRETVNGEGRHIISLERQKVQPGPTETFSSILGPNLMYGIIANDATFMGHLESNFALGTLHNSAANVQMAKNNKGGAGNNLIGAFTGSELEIGLNGNAGGSVVYTGFDPKGKLKSNDKVLIFDSTSYSEAEIKAIVANMIAYTNTKSAQLTGYGVSYKDVLDAQTTGDAYTRIDLAGIGDGPGTYYINFTEGEYAAFTNSTKPQIKVRTGQNVVLNIPDGDVTFKQFTYIEVNENGETVHNITTNSGADEDIVCRNVIFNCSNAVTAKTATPTDGIFLVPNAHFNNDAVSAGWVIADVIGKIGGQEWHNVYGDLPVEQDLVLQARKTVDGKKPDSSLTGTFEFKLYKLDGTNEILIDTQYNDGDGLVTFDNSDKYGITADGAYWYKIVETREIEGYIKDTSEYKVSVRRITIPGDPGAIIYSAIYYLNDEVVSIALFDNKIKPTSITVEKVWKQADGETPLTEEELRDKSIQVKIYQWINGVKQAEPYRVIELSTDAGWSKTLDDLPITAFIDDEKVEYTYTFEEVSVEGFEASYSIERAISSGKVVITNTKLAEDTEITIKKVWKDVDGETPLSDEEMAGKTITCMLYTYIDGVQQANPETITLPYNGAWERTLSNLPKTRRVDGVKHEYSYRIEEAAISGFDTSYSTTVPVVDGEIVITNTKNTTKVSVEKIWTNTDGTVVLETPLLDKITVDLYQVVNGNASRIMQNIELSSANQWKFEKDELPYKDGQGNVYTYYFEETTTGSFITTYSVKGSETIRNKTNPADTAISDGTIVINNKKNAEFELPETGGHGTTPYMLGAVLMIAIALVLSYMNARRREMD